MTKFWHKQLSNIGDCQIGHDCVIHSFVWISDGVIIGDKVKIEAFAFIPKGVRIGNNVFIGPRVTFLNDKHPPSGGNWEETIVKDGVSIGAGAVILPGLILNENCKVGAGSLVNRNVEANTTVFGNPARTNYFYTCEFCCKKFFSQDKRGVRFCSRTCYKIVWSDPIKKEEFGLVPKDYKIIAKYKEYKANCDKRNIRFNLTFEEFKTFWQFPCFYCDEILETIGLDRVDNSKDYEINNVVSCCWDCNRLKGNLKQEEFFEKVRKIYEKKK